MATVEGCMYFGFKTWLTATSTRTNTHANIGFSDHWYKEVTPINTGAHWHKVTVF